MSKTNQLDQTLFKTPFSREYWKMAAAELKNPRMLVFAAIMIALRVAMKPLSIPIAADLFINTAFFVNAFGAMIYGPVVAMVSAAVTDTLGCMLFPVGPYFFPFILTEIAGSLIFALFLYRAELTATRVLLSRFCICFFVNIVLNAPIMALFYQMVLGKSYLWFQLPRVIKNLALFPIESVVLMAFLRVTNPIARRAGLSFSREERLHFSRRLGALTACLLVLGSGLVTGYAIYNYNTTSLSSAWSGEQRYSQNCLMNAAILNADQTLSGEDTVSIVESAYSKVGQEDATYTVAVYQVDAAAFAANAQAAKAEDPNADYTMDTLRGYSKTPASKDTSLVRMATATVVADKKTGEIKSVSVEPFQPEE